MMILAIHVLHTPDQMLLFAIAVICAMIFNSCRKD